jgi:Flp pilus assembly protein CpaB
MVAKDGTMAFHGGTASRDTSSTLAPDGSDGIAGGVPTRPQRVIRRRRHLPDSRAVLGALLVAASIVLIATAYAGAGHGPRGFVVVAAHAIRPGDTLGADDLRRVRADLPRALRSHTFTDTAVLTGATALSPLGAGDLVQTGQVVRKRGGAHTTELSFPIDASRVGAAVGPGDRVAMVATYGTGTDAYSMVVGRDLLVLDVIRERDALGTRSGATVLTVALPGGAESLALAHATRAAELTVIRTTGTTAGAAVPTIYRPTTSGSVTP